MAEETHTRRIFSEETRKPLLYDLSEYDGGHEDGSMLSWGRVFREVWFRCREITAGCGLAWMAERSWREEMEKLAGKQQA